MGAQLVSSRHRPGDSQLPLKPSLAPPACEQEKEQDVESQGKAATFSQLLQVWLADGSVEGSGNQK